jgi:hypothetical protein
MHVFAPRLSSEVAQTDVTYRCCLNLIWSTVYYLVKLQGLHICPNGIDMDKVVDWHNDGNKDRLR